MSGRPHAIQPPRVAGHEFQLVSMLHCAPILEALEGLNKEKSGECCGMRLVQAL